jgi:hypothetical protein
MQTSIGNANSSADNALELRIAALGATAVLTLYNNSPDPLKVLSHVEATGWHYDWFTVTLVGDTETRVLHLYDNRDESGRVIVELGPGQSLEHQIDVVAWAKRPPNGARALAPGHYRMSAIYEVSDPAPVWNGKLESPAVDITIP